MDVGILVLGKILLYLGQRDYIQCQGENEDIHGVVYSKVCLSVEPVAVV